MTKEEFTRRLLFEQKLRNKKKKILNNPDYIKYMEGRAYSGEKIIKQQKIKNKKVKPKLRIM